jgi:hypothetical protein
MPILFFLKNRTVPVPGVANIVQAPQTVTASDMSLQYTNADWANRLCDELPNAWFPSSALEVGGVVYSFLFSLANNFPFLNTQIDYQTLQTRIDTATGTNLDAIAVDYFGTGDTALPRILGESDSAYASRIMATLLEQKSTLAAIQKVINAYIAANDPPYTAATVFDIMTQPAECNVLGVVPYQFVINLSYGVTTDVSWFMNDDPTGYLGDSTFLTGFSLIGVPDEGLDAAIREVKAEGTEPVYAVLVGV